MGCGGSKPVGAKGKPKDLNGLIASATDDLDLGQADDGSSLFEPLTDVPARVWSITTLTRLNLKKNALEVLPEEIGALEMLRVLDVSENRLSGPLPAALGNLIHLEELDFSENEVTEMPATIGSLKKLSKLIAFKNKMSKLPDAIGECEALSEVNFFNNKLIKVPAKMADLTNLDDLNVAGNKLKTLCKTDNWGKLTRLAIMWNTMVMLPSFAPMTSLEQLQMNNNMLSSFPDMGAMPALTLLDANTNMMEAMPETIGQMTSLTNINLRGNAISMVPTGLGELKALDTLNLGKNKIAELPSQLSNCVNLKILFVDDNPALSALPPALAACTKLERVNVMGCPIDSSDAEQAKALEAITKTTEGNGGWLKGT